MLLPFDKFCFDPCCAKVNKGLIDIIPKSIKKTIKIISIDTVFWLNFINKCKQLPLFNIYA